MADTLAFTCQALLLLYLINRRYPGLIKVGSTLLRVGLATCGAGLLAYLVLQHYIPGFYGAIIALFVSGIVVLPFLLPEIKLLVKLGAQPVVNETKSPIRA